MSYIDRYDEYCASMWDRICEPSREDSLDNFKEEAGEFLDQIVYLLYEAKEFSMENFEHCLEELCHKLDVSFPDQPMKFPENVPYRKAVNE